MIVGICVDSGGGGEACMGIEWEEQFGALVQGLLGVPRQGIT